MKLYKLFHKDQEPNRVKVRRQAVPELASPEIICVFSFLILLKDTSLYITSFGRRNNFDFLLLSHSIQSTW